VKFNFSKDKHKWILRLEPQNKVQLKHRTAKKKSISWIVLAEEIDIKGPWLEA